MASRERCTLLPSLYHEPHKDIPSSIAANMGQIIYVSQQRQVRKAIGNMYSTINTNTQVKIRQSHHGRVGLITPPFPGSPYY
jgi:hypothetical protein